MPDIYNIPTDFLKDEGFPVIVNDARLSGMFDDRLDDEFEWLRIGNVDGIDIDARFSPSEVLYRLDRAEYDRAFSEWAIWYKPLKDGGYLHQDYEQSASDAWAAHCENNKSTEEE